MYCNNAILTRIENSITMYPLTFVQPAYCFTIWLDQVSKIINAAWWFLFTNYKKSIRKENKRSRKSVELWYFYTELAVIMNKLKTIIPLLIGFKWLQFKCHEYKVVWLCLQWWIPHTLVWLCHNGLLTLVWLGPLPPSLAWSCFSWIPTLRCDHVSLMEPSTLVLGIPVTLILLVGAQAAVLGTILVVQLHVLIAAVRTIHSIIWLSVLWLGIFYSVYYGYVLCRLLQTGWSECRDIYTPTLLCSAWMFTFLVLDKNLEKTSVNYLLTIFLVGLSTLFIAWEYHYSNIKTRSDLGDFPLFCPTSRDLLHTFVHEYLVLYLPVTAIGLVQRSRSSKGIEKHNSLKR